jgi:hypothetical protein
MGMGFLPLRKSSSGEETPALMPGSVPTVELVNGSFQNGHVGLARVALRGFNAKSCVYN